MEIHQSAEDYLECILRLSKTKPVVRSIDIAVDMNYSKPSISVAMKNLRLNGYINVDKSGFITLTDMGKEVAEKIYERHLLLTDWLIFLGVAPEIAAEDACKIEHDLSPESYEAIKNHVREEMKNK
ncbi:MAG: metal-dependent transcriptional regulator [Eubacterium sp.]|nr:metal-dependent transcriptional regulator [Eubacterium sp.]